MRNPELYQRANRNLVRLASGEIRRELAAEAKKLSWAQERALERKKLKAELAAAKKELSEHQRDWDFLYRLDDLSGRVADMGVDDWVVMEEVDHQREKLVQRVVDLEDEISWG
jgi:hypothetical protein